MRIKKTSLHEASELHQVFLSSWRAFHENHGVKVTDETLSSFKFRITAYDCYSIYSNQMLVGGVEIRRESHSNYRLHRIFILPDYQGMGIGKQVVMEIEKQYPEVKEWTTDTPKFAKANQKFYRDLGYKEVGEKTEGNIQLVLYKKVEV